MKKQRGITLIALIVTIIILLILAGITINFMLGDNGILNRAKNAGETYEEQAAREKLEIALADLGADKIVDSAYNENVYIDDKLTKQNMIVNGDIVIVDGWQFEIDRTVPKIATSMGRGEQNEQIQIKAIATTSSDYTKATIQVEITYVGEITSITIKGETIAVPTPNNNVYTVSKEVIENGNYTILVKDKEGNYKTASITITDITEDMDIWNKADLESFRDKVNSGRTYEGRTVRVMADIDLANEEWIPIGAYGTEFRGTLEGNRKKIENLKITKSYEFTGLFAVIGKLGKIKNLEVDCNINVDDINNTELHLNVTMSVGGICGRNKGEISGCHVSGFIEGVKNSLPISNYSQWVCLFMGGIAGQNANKIYECYTDNLIINGTHNLPYHTSYGVYIGGIVGINFSNNGYYSDYQESQNDVPEVYNCYSFVTIKGKCQSQADIGGIAGLNQSLLSSNQAYLHNCYAVLEKHEESSSNTLYVGQIVGLLDQKVKIGGNLYIPTAEVQKEYFASISPIIIPSNSISCSNLQELINNISVIGEAFTEDINNINNGYPILKWQK